MLVTFPNDVKIYNLSAGKSLPEWLSDRKKRKLQQEDSDIRRRIELIQGFEMPDVSHCIRMTPDQQHICATGCYKPRVRCYDVNNLSMKFERGLDAEVIKMDVLSDGFEKLLFLEEDRWLEFHVAYGHYYRTRIPKFGRDFAYHSPSCELYIVASGSDIYRLNLEQGRFMAPLESSTSTGLSSCAINPEHHLFICGTDDGRVEAWDPRCRKRVGILECGSQALNATSDIELQSKVRAVTRLAFKNAMTMAVGTSVGEILLFDVRSNRPLLVKDHRTGLPIKSIAFASSPDQDIVLSMDSRILKLWHEDTGKAYTSIEPGTQLNDLCLAPKSGLMFMANEDQKMLTYYLPSIGPAPQWCAFLDAITEELEETKDDAVYDDYKFLTKSELDSLGLSHLMGSKLARSYMHGFFIDMRLYNQAKMVANPFAYGEYRKRRLREKLEEERASRLKPVKKLPSVNRELAKQIMDEADEDNMAETKNKKKKKKAAAQESLLSDSRFSQMWRNPDFEVDPDSEEFQLLNPVRAKLQKIRKGKSKRADAEDVDDEAQNKLTKLSLDNKEPPVDSEGSDAEELGDSSSDDDREFVEAMKKQHKKMKRTRQRRDEEEEIAADANPNEPSTSTADSGTPDISTQPGKDQKRPSKADRRRPGLEELLQAAQKSSGRAEPKLLELRAGEEFRGWSTELSTNRLQTSKQEKGLSMEERLAQSDSVGVVQTAADDNCKEVTFTIQKKTNKRRSEKQKEHLVERRKARRSAAAIEPKSQRGKPAWKR